jgi:tRNA threonylcarbamoyladenosine biosynthesis protein TsaB
MNLILNIDTAVDTASVCLSNDAEILQLASNENQKDHASWLHIAIAGILKEASCSMAAIKAVAVSIGPGSYTGLRVGLSTAKGICYAMNIPLIAVGTLEMMAAAVQDEATDLICPLIDARRMEVFTAVYNKTMQPIMAPQAMIVDENSFSTLLSSHRILFTGNGCKKLQPIIKNNNAGFSARQANASHLARLAAARYYQKEFADLAYTEPLYVKEFYSAV